MSGEDVFELCEGHQGSMLVCLESLIMIKSHKFVDLCKKYDVKGEMIWKLHEEVCKRDIWKTMILLEHIDNSLNGKSTEVISLSQLLNAIEGDVTFDVDSAFNQIVEGWVDDPVKEAQRIIEGA